MKKITLTLLLVVCTTALAMAQETVPSKGAGLGVSASGLSGMGLTYRYLQDWGWQVSGLVYFATDTASAEGYNFFWSAGGSLMKTLHYAQDPEGQFHTLFYGLWGTGLQGGTDYTSGGLHTGISTGPGIGIELGLWKYLSVHFEVGQGVTFELGRPLSADNILVGPRLGIGSTYRF